MLGRIGKVEGNLGIAVPVHQTVSRARSSVGTQTYLNERIKCLRI